MSDYSFRYTITPPTHTAAQRKIAQMSLFGNVLNMWATVELVMEMTIKDELNLTLEQACIVCGPLGGGAKVALFNSLLASKPERAKLVEAVRTFQGLVGRNALAHGFITATDWDSPWTIVWREVKNKLTVKTKTLMPYLNSEFMPAYDAVMALSGFTDQEIQEYGQSIAHLAQPERS